MQTHLNGLRIYSNMPLQSLQRNACNHLLNILRPNVMFNVYFSLFLSCSLFAVDSVFISALHSIVPCFYSGLDFYFRWMCGCTSGHTELGWIRFKWNGTSRKYHTTLQAYVTNLYVLWAFNSHFLCFFFVFFSSFIWFALCFGSLTASSECVRTFFTAFNLNI